VGAETTGSAITTGSADPAMAALANPVEIAVANSIFFISLLLKPNINVFTKIHVGEPCLHVLACGLALHGHVSGITSRVKCDLRMSHILAFGDVIDGAEDGYIRLETRVFVVAKR